MGVARGARNPESPCSGAQPDGQGRPSRAELSVSASTTRAGAHPNLTIGMHRSPSHCPGLAGACAADDLYVEHLDELNFDRAHNGRLTKGRVPGDIVFGARKMGSVR